MKKLLSIVLLGASLQAENLILSIDRDRLFADSKEGRNFQKSQEESKSKAEAEIRKTEESIRAESQVLEKQFSMLTRDTITEKQRSLSKKIKDLERKRDDAQQDLKLNFQIGYEKIRDNQASVVEKVFTEKGAKILVDKNTPGVLALAADIDITKEVLNEVNLKFEKSTLVKKENV